MTQTNDTTETFQEQLSRVLEMAHDANGNTWDLSQHDRMALLAVLLQMRLATDEVERLTGQRDELLSALKRAVKTIREWHDLPAGLSESDKATAWRVYSTHAPEMLSIARAIAKAEGREV